LINYQTSYQPFPKRYPDNMPKVRRVLHIRTSPDGLHWTPNDSFGADGPYLSDDQFITPDDQDYPDTEFYHFAPVNLGEFWAGTMVKYISQPPHLPRGPGMPHGPYLGYEWWTSLDGLTWTRPFRERSNLNHMPREFVYRLAQPIQVENELRWAINGNVYALDRNRMFYAYSPANTELVTPPLTLSGNPIELELSFEGMKQPDDSSLRQGYLMAELLDRDNRVLPGFERDHCVFTPNNNTRITLQWENQHPPDSTPLRLRLCFRSVRLYSLSW
jgi:hypothetical protein